MVARVEVKAPAHSQASSTKSTVTTEEKVGTHAALKGQAVKSGTNRPDMRSMNDITNLAEKKIMAGMTGMSGMTG